MHHLEAIDRNTKLDYEIKRLVNESMIDRKVDRYLSSFISSVINDVRKYYKYDHGLYMALNPVTKRMIETNNYLKELNNVLE